MGRLIDADALMKDIIKRFGCKPYIEVGNKCEYIHNIIEEQPTAYDIEKVVAEIEKQGYEVEIDDGSLFTRSHTVIDTYVAIAKVRKGGVE